MGVGQPLTSASGRSSSCGISATARQHNLPETQSTPLGEPRGDRGGDPGGDPRGDVRGLHQGELPALPLKQRRLRSPSLVPALAEPPPPKGLQQSSPKPNRHSAAAEVQQKGGPRRCPQARCRQSARGKRCGTYGCFRHPTPREMPFHLDREARMGHLYGRIAVMPPPRRAVPSHLALWRAPMMGRQQARLRCALERRLERPCAASQHACQRREVALAA